MDLPPDDPLAMPSTEDAASSLLTQQILLAASHHNVAELRQLLRSGTASVQDPETLSTPLHAAVAGAAAAEDNEDTAPSAPVQERLTNGDHIPVTTTDSTTPHPSSFSEPSTQLETPAEKTIKLLFQNGAIWNDIDANGETPGCLAWRLDLKGLYELFVDAGVRAELLLGRLDGYEELGEGDDDDEVAEMDESEVAGGEVNGVEAPEEAIALSDHNQDQQQQQASEEAEEPPELIIENNTYLRAPLTFSSTRILDASNNSVMMSWERDVMRKSAEKLLPSEGLAVLNIGHGMGIVDDFLQERRPSLHVVVEAHEGVLGKMRERGGWLERNHGVERTVGEEPNGDGSAENGELDGVILYPGRWQDVLPRLVEQNLQFDAIYFDTFAEDYKAFRLFFEEHVIALLKPEGRWSFFHGLGADRRICYDVYTKVVEMDLFEAGFDIEWENVGIDEEESAEDWNGVRRKYWTLDTYRLPLCMYIN